MAGKNVTRRRFLLGAAQAAAFTVLVRPIARADAVGAIDVHAHMPLLKFGGPLAPRMARVPSQGADAGRVALAEAVRGDDLREMARLRIEDMDRWGIEKSVVMPVDFGRKNDGQVKWEENRAVASICRKHSERLIPFLSSDPRRPDALERLEEAVKTLGMRGVKIHPLAGFAIDDKASTYAFYGKCAELDVPVLGHCRPVGLGERDQLSRPERYGRVAADFPELRLCLGHTGGGPWSQEALDVMEAHPNAYGDISTLQGLAQEDPAAFASILRRALDGPARTRLMYGSDWPTGRPRDGAFLDLLRAGVPGEDGKPTLDAQEIRLILYTNSLGFLGLGTN